jgi:RimJ/RimL family protein N-acetyltransferase
MAVSLRRANAGDADFLLELLTDAEIRRYLGPRTVSDRDAVLAEIARSEDEPDAFGRFVVEEDGEPVGSLGFHTSNEINRIARLERLAIHPRARGRRLADDAARLFQRLLLVDLGFHRLELEIYAFNERARAHAERSGFVREGVRRKANLRDGEWLDSVMFALLREDLEP